MPHQPTSTSRFSPFPFRQLRGQDDVVTISLTQVVQTAFILPTSITRTSSDRPTAHDGAQWGAQWLCCQKTARSAPGGTSASLARSCDMTTNLPFQSDEDAVYEQDILRDPGSTKPWLAYIEFKLQHGTIHEQAFVIERACLQLPRSYKLWKLVSNLQKNICDLGSGDLQRG